MITLWRYTDSIWKFDRKFIGEKGRVISAVLHSNNNIFARVNVTASTVEIWSFEASKVIKKYDFGSVAFHQNNSIVAVRESQKIIISNYITDETLLKIHVGDNYSQIAFNKNGNEIVTINDSGELVVVDLQTKSRRIFSQDRDYASKFAIAPSKNIACVLYESGTIGVWDIGKGILKQTISTNFYEPDGIAISFESDILAIGSSALDGSVIELWYLGSQV